jgi:hypothetical protein
MTDKMNSSKNTTNDWKSLYKIGGVSAWIFVAYSLATIIIFMLITELPASAREAFDLLAKNRLAGLLRLDALTLLTIPLYYPIFLSICMGIKKDNIACATLGGLLAFAGITLFLATPSAFSLVPLSEKYASAATPAQQERFLAAGEALLASDMWHGSGAMIGGILMLVAALIVSVVMLRSDNFSKATAYLGILTHGLDLIRVFVSIFAPQVGTIIMMVAGPLYLVWFPLLGRDLFRLAKVQRPIDEVVQ